MPTTPSSLSHVGSVVVAVVTVATVQSVGLSASRTGLLSRLLPSHVQGRGGRGRSLEGLQCLEELTEMDRWADAGVGGIRELACSHLVQHVLPTPLWPRLSLLWCLCPCVSAGTLGASPDSVLGSREGEGCEDCDVAPAWWGPLRKTLACWGGWFLPPLLRSTQTSLVPYLPESVAWGQARRGAGGGRGPGRRGLWVCLAVALACQPLSPLSLSLSPLRCSPAVCYPLGHCQVPL